jgi:hypothetical protein
MKKIVYFALAVTIAVALTTVRIYQAKTYMNDQIARLSNSGPADYVICDVNYLTMTKRSGSGLSITVTARKKEVNGTSDDGYHYIEIEYPWIPFLFRPSHRI